jgi:hypothetical protein
MSGKNLQVQIPDIEMTALKIKAAKAHTNVSEIVREMVNRATIKEVMDLKLDVEGQDK